MQVLFGRPWQSDVPAASLTLVPVHTGLCSAYERFGVVSPLAICLSLPIAPLFSGQHYDLLPCVCHPAPPPGASFADTPKINKRSEPRKLDAAAELVWPEAQKFFEEVMAIEFTAAQHGILGPARSSDAWPLDGHFTSFERTEANIDGYGKYVTVKCMAAVARLHEQKANGERFGDFDAVVRATELAASSPAMLYTCQQVTPEEGVLLACLSEANAVEAQKALGWVEIAEFGAPPEKTTLRPVKWVHTSHLCLLRLMI